MDEIKEGILRDYNAAVECFNKKDYRGFFMNIRPSIEWLAKLMIMDIIGNEDDAYDVIDGEVLIVKSSSNTYQLQENSSSKKPSGKAFPLLVPKAYFSKHPDISTSYMDRNKERLRRGLESCGSEFARLYDLASGFGNHTDKIALDISVQAIGCAAFIEGYFDFAKSNSILSSSTLSFLSRLSDFNLSKEDRSEQFQQEIDELISTLERKETSLLEAQAMQLEIEKKKLEAETKNSVLEAEILSMQKIIDELNEQLASIGTPTAQQSEDKQEEDEPNDNKFVKPKLKLSKLLKISTASWDVEEESMDDDQLDLIEMTIDKSMLVAGCAGSGKSVIAMHKAEQVAKTGASVILIAYTKSLSAFMREGIDEKTLPYKFYHHYKWREKLKMPSADYIIVDEIQDFTREEILEFMQAARKAYFFFGDSAQSIYKQYGKNTIDIEEISALTGLVPMQLYNNYRLPRSVAKITQGYVGVNVNPYEDKIYQNKEKALPHFIHLDRFEDQIMAIQSLVEKYTNQTIGVLLPSNELVLKICNKLLELDTPCEFKYTDDNSDRFVDTLDFETDLPKIMTYHSAKGLQFDVVILPMYVGASDENSKKALYVAMTRTMHHLYLMYSTPFLAPPLAGVPSKLYIKSL